MSRFSVAMADAWQMTRYKVAAGTDSPYHIGFGAKWPTLGLGQNSGWHNILPRMLAGNFGAHALTAQELRMRFHVGDLYQGTGRTGRAVATVN